VEGGGLSDGEVGRWQSQVAARVLLLPTTGNAGRALLADDAKQYLQQHYGSRTPLLQKEMTAQHPGVTIRQTPRGVLS